MIRLLHTYIHIHYVLIKPFQVFFLNLGTFSWMHVYELLIVNKLEVTAHFINFRIVLTEYDYGSFSKYLIFFPKEMVLKQVVSTLEQNTSEYHMLVYIKTFVLQVITYILNRYKFPTTFEVYSTYKINRYSLLNLLYHKISLDCDSVKY